MTHRVNIGGDPADAHYRYTMPRLQIKVEGSGNGVKTLILNSSDIAKSLHRDPELVSKFLGIELASLSKFSQKRGTTCINGNHDPSSIAKKLDEFIKLFVLCPCCTLPESYFRYSKKGISFVCQMCGHTHIININKHKIVASLILIYKKKTQTVCVNDEVVITEQPDTAIEEKCSTDVSKSAVLARKTEEFDGFKTASELFATFFTTYYEFFATYSVQKEYTLIEMLRLQKQFLISDFQTVCMLLNVIINPINPYQSFVENLELFELLVSSSAFSSNIFIDCIEKLASENPQFGFPKILKYLYDSDVLDESTILKWYKSVDRSGIGEIVSQKVKKSVKFLIDWLEQAEEESE